jgi:uncharacterized membrane protein
MPTAETEALFDAVLHPHRSLSPRGVRYVILGLAASLTLVALYFAALGAWPVLPFFGFEILLIWWAFRTNARDGQAFERVCLTAEELVVARVRPSGDEQRHRFAPPNWLTVELLPAPGGDNEIFLRSHGRTLKVGGFLTPEERADFADALRQALRRLQSAPASERH